MASYFLGGFFLHTGGGNDLSRKWLNPITIGLFILCLASGARAEEIFSSLLSSFTKPHIQVKIDEKQIPTNESVMKSSKQGIYGIHIGQKSEEITRLLGAPQRKDLSSLGYEWWIFNKNLKLYVQVGIQNGKVVDLYSNAPTLEIGGVKVGTAKAELTKRYAISNQMKFQYEGASFTLSNPHDDRPLTLVQDSPVIFYLDVHDGYKVTGIRKMSKELLVKSKSYDLEWSYTGKAPQLDPPKLSSEQIKKVHQSNERQSLDLANVSRQRLGLPFLSWNEQAAAVARGHSQDMLDHQFFDHISASTGRNPFERMKKGGIRFRAAGENIAMGYPDAIEAHHGWMNSFGHRENILNKDFTTLGVGFVETYSTQNFVTP